MSLQKRSLRDRLVVEGSVGLAVLLPLAAVFAHRAYAPILLGMAIAAGVSRRHWITGWKAAAAIDLRRPPTAALMAMIALCGWIGLSTLWSPTPATGLRYLGFSAAVLASSLVVAEIVSRSARDVRFIAATFVGAVLFGVALFFFEAHTGGYLRLITPPADPTINRHDDIIELGRGFTALLPSIFPALAMIAVFAIRSAGARRWGLVAAIVAIICVAFSAALELTIAANSAAVLAGAGAGVLAFAFPRRMIAGLIVLYVVALVGAPLLALLPAHEIVDKVSAEIPVSWLHRLFIWRNAAANALDCLPFGCGADYARALSHEAMTFDMARSPGALPLMPNHPHNSFLQIWLELGLPGVILSAAFLVAGGRMLLAAAPARAPAAGLAGAGGAVFVLAMVEMSLWQEWRLASIGVAAAGAALAHRLWVDGAGNGIGNGAGLGDKARAP